MALTQILCRAFVIAMVGGVSLASASIKEENEGKKTPHFIEGENVAGVRNHGDQPGVEPEGSGPHLSESGRTPFNDSSPYRGDSGAKCGAYFEETGGGGGGGGPIYGGF